MLGEHPELLRVFNLGNQATGEQSRALAASVVAYAIAGTVRFDIEKDVLGLDKDGQPVRLKDIWPTDAEIDAVVAKSVNPTQFRAVY